MLPQHLSKTGVDINLPDCVGGLWGLFPAIPDAPANTKDPTVQIQIVNVKPSSGCLIPSVFANYQTGDTQPSVLPLDFDSNVGYS